LSAPELSGRLGFAEVGRYLPVADELAARGELDLSKITHADSAGLALLLEITRRSRRRGQTLRLRGAQAQLRGLAGFFKLDSILTFDH
jgi:ABC-type transporter Mla MlaB component